MAKTQTVYDLDDQAIATIRFERKAGSTDGSLDDNAVKSYSYTWYDKAGKVLASADFGTGSSTSTNIYANDGEIPAYNPNSGPFELGADGQVAECLYDHFASQQPDALITCYAYDSAGRQKRVFNRDGTITDTEYDGLGRVLLVTENVGGDVTDLDGVRRTAHRYDEYGRLELMAAVMPMPQLGHRRNMG